MSLLLHFLSQQAASSLSRRDDSPEPHPIPTYGIVGIVLLIVAVLSIGGVVAFFIMKRRRTDLHAEDRMRGSFVPNNFKVIGGIYSKRPGRRPSTLSTAPLSPYQPTTKYGQYQPPVPQPAYIAGSRVGSPTAKYNPYNLVRHARDKSLPSLP